MERASRLPLIVSAPATTSLAAVADQPVGWLGTLGLDGQPHLVPVWFVWDGKAITVLGKPGCRKFRNIEHSTDVALAIEREGMASVLIRGTADLVGRAGEDLGQAFDKKYGSVLSGLGWSAQRFMTTYSQVANISPTWCSSYGALGA